MCKESCNQLKVKKLFRMNTQLFLKFIFGRTRVKKLLLTLLRFYSPPVTIYHHCSQANFSLFTFHFSLNSHVASQNF